MTGSGIGFSRNRDTSGRVASSQPRGNTSVHSHHARRTALAAPPFTLSDDDYIQNCFSWALPAHSLTQTEQAYWNDIFRTAYSQGPTALQNAARELGMTLFESWDYAARNRSDHDYVYDLYKTYLKREPDQGGWDAWTSLVPSIGRESVRHGFDQSSEFANLVATITPNGSASGNATALVSARVDPFNQPGNQLATRDCEWNLPLLSLPGRAGLDLGLGLSYSSQVWTRSGQYLYFDQDSGSPSPGFRLGFATIQSQIFDAQTARNVFVLITSSGQRVELKQVGTSSVYEAADSSSLQLTDNTNDLLLRTTDGTQISYGWFEYEWRATQIKDRNGNYLTIENDGLGDIQHITDALGRVITFNYDTNLNLISITQNWNNGTHTWATFGWGAPLGMDVSSLSGISIVGYHSGEYIPVLRTVGLEDGSYFTFDYAGLGQVSYIHRYTADNAQRSYTGYDYAAANGDCPRLTQTRVYAENWTGINAVPGEVTTQYGVEGDMHTISVVGDPGAAVYKESYGTGWQRGLVTASEIWGKSDPSSSSVKQKWTTTSYTQDNTSVSYQTNPRVTETNIYDASGNRRRTTVSYTSYSLPSDVYEYAADATTVLRRSHTDYNLDSTYTNRRVIGLPSAQYVCDGTQGATPCSDSSVSSLLSKATLQYDEAGSVTAQDSPVQHDDTNFGSGFVSGRGNLTSARRYNVSNLAQSTSASATYNTAGSTISATDALNHVTTISYADSFSVDGTNVSNPSFTTMAYPTTVTDADGYSSNLRYNYDFGAKTRAQGPPPAGQSQGAIQTTIYDAARRVQQVTTTNTGAYTRYVYGANYMQSWSSVNSVADDAYSMQIFDGVGRTILAGAYHPGSAGGYRAVWTQYDAMGRLLRQSNPTEITGSWQPYGDDAAGWVFSVPPVYDWKGRTLTSYNQDGTYKTASYAGCGCAGGEVMTLTDEVGRQQKVYSDVLGRQWKTEILNTNGSVYSTTTNTLNARDQVTNVRQTDNATSTYQDTVMTYDGYGRLQTKHVPEQSAGTNTVYAYNNDDTIYSVTDARGASATYGYNNRHLATSINYSAPTGVTPTSNVTFGYDAAGNRTSMTDGAGTVTYHYDQLSRVDWEERSFTGVSGAFRLTYSYNLAGQITSITDPFSGQVTYQRDGTGRVQQMGANGYTAYYHESNYNEGTIAVTQLASNIQYRAWGGVKQITYGNSVSEATSFNARLQPTQFNLSNVRINLPNAYQPPYNIPSATMTWTYDYYADGRANHAYDNQDHSYDRSWEYDHAARLKAAHTDLEARGQANPNHAGPYQQTIQYDAWSNMTNRNGFLYGITQSDAATYVNNRRQDPYNPFTFDAEANVLTTPTNTHTFDASGQQTRAYSTATVGDGSAQFPEQPAMEVTQTYDGRGAPASHDEITRQENYTSDGNGNQVLSSITSGEERAYYVRSTALGGAILSEVVPNYLGQGTRLRTNIYLNGQRIGQAQGLSGQVEYEHTNPVNGSWLVTNGHPNWRMMTREERDPLGADINLLAQQYSQWSQAQLYNEAADPTDYIDGCFLDGAPVNCNSVWFGKETAEPCPSRNCGPRVDKDRRLTQPFQAFADGWGGFLPQGTNYIGDGRYAGSGPPGDRREGRLEQGAYGDYLIMGSVEPQNSSNPQITPCDRKFASIFGDSDAVGRTAYDYNGQYRGLDPAARARAAGLPRTDFSSPVWDAEHLYNFPHLSGNLAGTANADIYVPGNYTGQPTGPTKTDAVVTFYYKNFFGMSNVTLAVFHVANFSPERMADGSVRIGTTGGPGGNTPGPSPNLHAHFELWSGRGYRPPGAGRDAARIPLTPVICK